MVGTLYRKSGRDLWRNLTQYFAMFVIVVVAMTLLSGLAAGSDKLKNRAEKLFSEGNLADAWITTAGMDGSDDAFMDEWQQSAGFTFERRLFLTVSVAGEHALTAYLVVTEDETPKISHAVEGYVTDGVMMDGALASKLFIGEGSAFSFKMQDFTFSTKLDSVVVHPETVSANSVVSGDIFMNGAVFRKLLSQSLRERYPFLSERMCEKIAAEKMFYNQYVLAGCGDTEPFCDYYRGKHPDSLLSVFTRETFPAVAVVEEDVAQSVNMSFTFPLVFFLVALLIIVTTCSQMILNEHKQIGTMQALGVRRGEIILQYALRFAAVVAAGCAVGSLFGVAFVPSVLDIKYKILYVLPNISTPIPWAWIFGCTLVFILTAVCATLLSCRAEFAEPPALAMRGRRKSPVHAHGITKEMPLPIPVKLAFRNLEMKKGRALMVVFGVLCCTALLLSAFGMNDCLAYSLDNELSYAMPYDLKITFAVGQEESVLEAVKKEKGVLGAELLYNEASTVRFAERTMDTNFFVVSPDSKVFCGDVATEGFTVTQKVAEELGVAVGDELAVTVAGEQYVGTVRVVLEASLSTGVFVRRTAEFAACRPTSILVYAQDGESLSGIRERLLAVPNVATCMTREEKLGFVNTLVGGISFLTGVIALFSIALAGTVLFNLIRLNYTERMADSATMRALGMNGREIAASLMLENGLLTFVGLVGGLFCGFPLMRFILGMNETVLISYLYAIFPLSYVGSVALVVGVWLLVNTYFLFRLGRVSMTESLKARE